MPLLTRHHGRDWHERSPFLFWEFSHGFLGNRPFLDHFFDSNVWYRPLDVYLHFLRLVFALSHGALPNSNYQVVILEQTFGPHGRVDICEPVFYQVAKKDWWGTTIKDGMRFLAWFYNGWKPYTTDVFTHKYEITSLDLWIIVSDTFALYILLHFSSDTHQHTTKTLAYPCL